MKRSLLVAGAVLAVAALVPQIAAAEPSLVVVRHADRPVNSAEEDPALSQLGEERAAALATALGAANITSIITTQYRRTQETARPLARQLGIEPQEVKRQLDISVHVSEVVEAVRKKTGQVLVVGHSDTVSAIVAALGGPNRLKLCETSYGHVFVITPSVPTSPVLWLRYGKPDPPPSKDCL
jgi:phosphohistidine phosphatase SixA